MEKTKDYYKNLFKNKAFNMVSKNIYVNSACHELRIILSGMEKMTNLVDEMSQMDFFYDISPLRAFRLKIEEDKSFYSLIHIMMNKKIYGIWINLFGKCNISHAYETPSIEHGLILYEKIFSDITHNSRVACATFSSFRKHIIQSNFPIPVFCVGPYIHYADMFYSQKKLIEMKKKLGKTLLVFPTHSTYTSNLTVQQEKFIKMIKKEASKYNSVLINTFWWNINDPLIQKLEVEGYKVISCGYKDDINFLSRLKSYLYLADFAIGDSIGTHIGYCIDCNVPFMYRETNTQNFSLVPDEYIAQSSCKKNEDIIKKLFLNTDRITDEQKKICNYYWGCDCLKTKAELQKICDISKELTHLTHGFRNKLYKYSAKLLKTYKQLDIIKYQLLLDALPNQFLETGL